MNTIGRIEFDFTMQNEQFAQSLYAGWDSFFASSFEKVADDLFKRYKVDSEIVEIDSLDLNLGRMTETEFYDVFPKRLKEALEESLQNSLYLSASTTPPSVRRQSVQRNAFDILCYFLLHGTLPWYAQTKQEYINHLFLQVIKDYPGELKKFLQLYGHYTTLQQRLVYQLNNPALEEGIRLMRSTESTFICSYIHYLREKYTRIQQPQITETNYRYAIWQVVYAWILTDRSSSFDKKSFLQTTLARLASHLNITYITLLTILTEDIAGFTHKQKQLPELLRLLSDLRDDVTLQLRKGKLSDLSALFNWLDSSLQKEINKRLSDSSFSPEFLGEWLIPVLSNVDSCRLLFSHLKEEEILRLVPLVMPNESEFIIGYARSLDKQKEQGALQGKAGGDFVRLKWMVIFPVLLENRGAGFNRKYFVRKVLHTVAARYNLTVMDLLSYFMQQDISDKLDPVLRNILISYHAEIKKANQPVPEEKQQHHGQQASSLTHPEKYVIERQQLIKNLIYLSGEEERYILLGKLYPADISFIRSVINLVNTPFFVQKTGSESVHSRLVWEKIIQVLTEYAGRAFVRQAWLYRLLQLFANHYKTKTENLYKELSNTIRQGSVTTTPDLKQIIMDQSNHWNDLDFIQPNNEMNQQGAPDAYYVHNAGVVLIFPFLSRLFSILRLLEQGKFIDEEAKIRAIFILQYVVYGDEYSKKEFPEYELTLNKILVGYHSEAPLPKSLELTEEEKKTIDEMLKGVLSHWEKLSRTSTAALRQAFLERSGALKVEDDHYLLTVEEKAYDMLIDSMPWSFRMIKYPWMEKRMEVKWR